MTQSTAGPCAGPKGVSADAEKTSECQPCWLTSQQSHAKPLVSAPITADLDDDAALELLVAAHETVDHGHCWACGSEPALPAPGVSVEELVLVDVGSRAGTERRALCPLDAFGCVSCGDATGTIQALDEWRGWLECPACFAGRLAQRRAS